MPLALALSVEVIGLHLKILALDYITAEVIDSSHNMIALWWGRNFLYSADGSTGKRTPIDDRRTARAIRRTQRGNVAPKMGGILWTTVYISFLW